MPQRVALAERVIGCSTTGRAALLAMQCPPSPARRQVFWRGVLVGVTVASLVLVAALVAW